MSELEDATALHASGAGEWRAVAAPHYEAGTGMFGGWTAAVLLRSVIGDARAQGTPSAITVSYVRKITPGSELRLVTRPLGGSRALGFWNSELALAGQDEVCAVASVLMASRKPSDAYNEWSMPSAPEPATLTMSHPPGTFGERTEVRQVHPQALFDQPSTRSISWVRETSGRPIDYVQLAYLADAYAPRILYCSKGPRPSSTITMSVYFHATPEELAEVGDDYVLSEAIGTRAEHATMGSQVRLWSRKGKLLATSEQLSWFR